MKKWVWAFAVLAALSGCELTAQIVTASLGGTISDPSSAVVPNATVRIVNTSTGLQVHTITDSGGRYLFPSLPPGGPYSIYVQAAGFSTQERSGITLEVNQMARVDFTLQVGAATETVKVNAEAALVEATTAAQGQVINSRNILNLPLNARNAYSLVFLGPGVEGTVGTGYNSENISINGGRPGSSDILVDGIPASPPLVVPIQGFSVFPSVESVQEFKVQTNTYSAEFGRSGSGVINLIYKSGTNSLHGSAFEFVRNSDLDSNNFFSNRNGVGLPSFKRHQFGGSLGGPVDIPKVYKGKDKTFFFFAYEGLRQGAARTLTTTVPTAVQRAGDFSQTLNPAGQLIRVFDPLTTVPAASGSGFVRSPFPGNIIPANRINPVSANAIKYYPLPNQPGNPFTGFNNYYAAATQVVSSNQIDAKVDENLSDTDRFFVRFSRRDLSQPVPQLFPSADFIAQGGDQQPQVSNSAAVDYTKTFSATDLLEVRFGFSRTKLDFTSLSLGFNPTQLGLPSYIAANADYLLFPGIAPQSYYTLGNAGSGDTRNPGFQTALLGVTNTRIFRGHTLHFGWEGRQLRTNDMESDASTGNYAFSNAITQGPNPNVASSTAGNGIASMLLGIGNGSMIINSKNAATQSIYYGAFVQDDWRVTQKLTLNLGLRYDLDMPETERYNRMENLDLAAPQTQLDALTGLTGLHGGTRFVGVDGHSRMLAPPQYANFGPRFGFAYQVDTNTVLRGGYGVFYGPSYRQAGVSLFNEGYGSTTPYTGAATPAGPFVYLNNPFPTGLNLPAGNSLGLLTGLGSDVHGVILGDNHVPYTENWDFDIQRQLPGNVLVDASYVGSHGVHLTMGQDGDYYLNQLTPGALALGNQLQQSVSNPFYGIIKTGPEANRTVPLSYLVAPYPQFDVLYGSYPTGGYSIYHALQLKVEKRFSHGLNFLASYTAQKSIDDFSIIQNVGNGPDNNVNQNIYDNKAERGVSSNDISQRLVISGIYQIPIGRGRWLGRNWNRGVNAFLGGWQMNGIASYQTGFPLTLLTQDTCNCGNHAERPNNNGQNPALSGPISARLNEYFNTSVFSQPAPFTFGNTGRTLPNVRGPGLQNIDFSLFKNFQPVEKLTIEFRAEAFNILNQVVFGMPNENLASNQFGVISSQANTPREIQLALKLIF